MAKYGSLREEPVPNADERVKLLLEKLIALYMDVFDPKIFSEDTQKIKAEAIPGFKERLLELRKLK